MQISSLEGVAPVLAGECAYAASKFAREVAHLGIGVTVVEPGPIRTEFGERAAVKEPEDPDYDESVGAALAAFADLAGRQPNGPHRVAAAIVTAIHDPNPPFRLALGAEAIQGIRAKLARQSDELDAWQELGTSTG